MIKKNWDPNSKLLYIDTVSSMLESNPYEIMLENKTEFDSSDYPKDHIRDNDENIKVVGKFKDELNESIMREFCSFTFLIYNCLNTDPVGLEAKNVFKCKGIKKNF